MPDSPPPLTARILIVDDDPLICTWLNRALVKEGYELFIAYSGEEALEKAFKIQPDLIILDILLPKMNGYEACQALSRDSRTSSTPVIFLTTKGGPEDLARGLDLGAVDYIAKPFKVAELVVRVRARLKFSRDRAAATMPMATVRARDVKALFPSGDANVDDTAAKFLVGNGLIGVADLERAKAYLTVATQQDKNLPLLDVLVKIGAITESQRDNAEKKLVAAERGGAHQLGNYILLKKVGEGGMGAVYLASDATTNRRVALKVLSARFNDDLEFVSRFRREADAMKMLHHPNIAEAYEVGEDLGLHYFAMELCEGKSLDALLARDGAMEWRRASVIVAQVAQGLQHAHERGLLHRDIKPGNIFLTDSGPVKILDFGLLKKIEQTEQSINTQTGTTLGTPDYISPEQARGDKLLDGRLDMYSLGATFYHLLTGSPPYIGNTPALVLMKHLSDGVPDPRTLRPDLPEGVAIIVMKMLAKHAEHRYADCAELVIALNALLEKS